MHPLRNVHSSCLRVRTSEQVDIPHMTAAHCPCPQVHSHLYATDGRMVGTFQRIDIPILHEWVPQLLCIANSCSQPERSVCLWPALLPLFNVNVGQRLASLPAGLISTITCFLQVILAGCSGFELQGNCLLGRVAASSQIARHVALHWSALFKRAALMSLQSADCDVFFRQQMKLVDWGTPLPVAAGMG